MNIYCIVFSTLLKQNELIKQIINMYEAKMKNKHEE